MRLLRPAAPIALLLFASAPLWAQYDVQPADTSEILTVFPHPDTSRLWLSGQMNIIFQTHPAFPAAYTSDHSLRPTVETATSSVLTMFTGFRLADRIEVLFDLESAGGRQRRLRPGRILESRRRSEPRTWSRAVRGSSHAASDHPAWGGASSG